VLAAVRTLIAERGTRAAVTVQQARVIGQALARVADAQVGATLDDASARLGDDAGDGGASGEALRAIERQLPIFEHFVVHAWRRHLVAAALRLAATPAVGEHPLVVGFADLAGFTALSSSLDAAELAATVDRFEAVAYDHILGGGGRVVKTIGDEVMFAADTAPAAARIALDLVEAYASDPALPNARIGLAYGPVLPWEGDLYGPTVNLASRLVNFARPGTVLLDDALGAALDGAAAIALRRLRPVKLKGLGAVRAWVLRRSAPPT
jgi:adenylate cyclase